MLDLKLKNYVDWRVASVMPVRDGFGYRIFLKYQDGSEKLQQKSGFKTKKEAEKAKEKTIAELYNGTYIVYSNISVAEFMAFWLEEDIKKRTESHETYYNFGRIVKNHIVPILGKKKMPEVNRGDIQKLFNTKAGYSRAIAENVKTVMNVSFRYALSIKVISENPVVGLGLPKIEKGKKRNGPRTRNIDSKKTLNLEQIFILLEKSKDTPIHMQVLFNVLMGLRRSEINGLKYSDIDYINQTLRVERQLGIVHNSQKEEFAPKTFTKQEVGLKTKSSYREVPIPDYVFEAILQERQKYEKNRSRRINDKRDPFFDGNYICCSTYGKPRSKTYHQVHYKKLLMENGLPDIRWHDLRSTFCTLLIKNDISPKAVSKLMGHAKEIITIDVYADNKEIIIDGVPEIEAYMKEVLPNQMELGAFKEELQDVVPEVEEYLQQFF